MDLRPSKGVSLDRQPRALPQAYRQNISYANICIVFVFHVYDYNSPVELSPLAENKDFRSAPYCRFAGGRTDAVWGETPSPPLVSFERFLSPLHLPRSFLRLSWASARRFCSLPSIVATLPLHDRQICLGKPSSFATSTRSSSVSRLGQPWLKPVVVNKAVECLLSVSARQILHVKSLLESIPRAAKNDLYS